MTILCGILAINNQVDCASGLEEMMQSLKDSVADATAVWVMPNIALGQKTLQITLESIYDNFPVYRDRDKLTIVGNIRLDNRPELFAKLGIPQAEYNQLGDASLILAAYEKWGQKCPEYLLGDFSFVIWDGIKQELFCCVDHFGSQGLFYFYDGKKFIFASTPNEILAVSGVSSGINQNKLSTLIFKEAKHLFWEESWFENIFPIPAATTLTVDRNGIRKHKYWTPELGNELSFKSEAEYTEAFQEIMFRSVGDRMRSRFPITALLSGGLDSSAVVSVAAKILEKQNRELQVFSAVLPNQHDAILTDERYFIDQFRSFPNVKINYITAPEKGFFSGMHELTTTIIGPNLISRHYLYTAFADQAKAMGSRVILDGGGGELGATFHGNGCYAEMFKNLRWTKLWREINARKTLVGESVRSNLLSNVLKPILPDFLINLRQNNNSYSGKTRVNCIQEDLVEVLRKLLESKTIDLNQFSNRDSSSHRLNQLRLLQTKQNKAHGSANLGEVELRFPLMDKRLLEFCLAVPLDLKVKNGYRRYTIRVGLDKILPSEIQWRNSKGAFSVDYNRRYREQLPKAQEFLEAIEPNDPVRKIVDIEKLKAMTHIPIKDEEYGTVAEMTARDFVPQGIYLIHFLRRFKEFQF